MSLVLQSSGGGSVTIQEPATASNFTQTLPAATGTVMVSGNQPAFSANANTTQSISSGTFTKVLFANERFDTNNNFASSTFTPTVAGYYQLNTSVYYASSPSGQAILFIYKNGSAYTEIGRLLAGPGTLSGSCVVHANGSTDNFEIYFFSSGASNTLSSGTDAFYVNFSGSLVRTA
jgi:hypothetical protein